MPNTWHAPARATCSVKHEHLRHATCERNACTRTALVCEIVPPLNVTAPSSMRTTPPSCAPPAQRRLLQSAAHPVRPHPPAQESARLAAPPRPLTYPCFRVGYRHGVEQRGALGHGEHAAAAFLCMSASHRRSAAARPALRPVEPRLRSTQRFTRQFRCGRAARRRCNHATSADAPRADAPRTGATRTDATRT